MRHGVTAAILAGGLGTRLRAAVASLVLTSVRETSQFGRVEAARDGSILAFEEKGSSRGRGWINAGIYLLQRQRIADIPPEQPLSFERDVLPRWISEGGVHGF